MQETKVKRKGVASDEGLKEAGGRGVGGKARDKRTVTAMSGSQRVSQLTVSAVSWATAKSTRVGVDDNCTIHNRQCDTCRARERDRERGRERDRLQVLTIKNTCACVCVCVKLAQTVACLPAAS